MATAHSYNSFFTQNNQPSNIRKKDYSFLQSRRKKNSPVNPSLKLKVANMLRNILKFEKRKLNRMHQGIYLCFLRKHFWYAMKQEIDHATSLLVSHCVLLHCSCDVIDSSRGQLEVEKHDLAFEKALKKLTGLMSSSKTAACMR